MRAFAVWVDWLRASQRFSIFSIALAWVLATGWSGQAIAATPSASPRTDVSIDADWTFLQQDIPNAQARDFDDSTWDRVHLPHCWIQETKDDRSTYYSGPAWYRHHLAAQPPLAGQRTFLRFGAAGKVAEVFVNGVRVGGHKGAFGAFVIDITTAIQPGDNVLAVRVNNASDPDVAPLNGDFTQYGGLYRSVHLLTVNPIHISPLDDAGPGVYLNASVAEDQGNVKAVCKLRNDGAEPSDITIVGKISDAAGKLIATTSISQQIAANSDDMANLQLSIPSPHLWDGTANPYLYQASIELHRGEVVIDRVDQPLGFRTFNVDPKTGLTLNGHPYDVHGVNYHAGRPSVGWASTPAMQAEDNQLMCEMGCTGVRMAHYQHDENEYALCDRSGLIVWAELALVNQMHNTPGFRENIKQQLRELVKQNYNHPSIFFWSMYNEIWVAEKGKGSTADDWKLIEELVAEAHELDPNRLTTGAAVSNQQGPVSFYMDVTGMNFYDGWYSGSPESWPKTLEAIHKKFPDKSIGISEYGAGASVMQHSYPTTRPKPASKWHPEEWQAIVHEHAWNAMRKEPWLWCKLAWCMFDFGSVGRNEGDAPGINDKGLVTADRKTRKDAFYFYKACWTKDPLVHITASRLNPRAAGEAEVKVYSNCASVELLVDGISIGKQTSTDHIFKFLAVKFPVGHVQVKAVGTGGSMACADEVSWDIDAARPATQPSN